MSILDGKKPSLFGRRISRRTVLTGGGVLAGAAFLGVAPTFSARAGNRTKIRLAWTEFAACHSPIAFGVAKGIYDKHDLDIELFYQGASGQTLVQSLATGKADAGAGLLLDWVKPLEQGLDVSCSSARMAAARNCSPRSPPGSPRWRD